MAGGLNVTVIPQNGVKVRTNQQGLTLVSSNLNNPATVNRVQDVGDVDIVTNGKIDGSVLVYKATTNKWTSTLNLDQQVMDGGQF
jgi:hypothetical protein